MRSWFIVDGTPDPDDRPEGWECRFPPSLVERMLLTYTNPGDRVIDPFCGFATTLRVCALLGRDAVGFEIDAERCAYAARFLSPSTQLVHDAIENIAQYAFPLFDFAICSLPFRSFGVGGPNGAASDYDADLRHAFKCLRPHLRHGARLVVETVNLIGQDGGPAVPRGFQTVLALSQLFTFEREYVCCDVREQPVTDGYHHSYLAVFVNQLNGVDDRTCESCSEER